MNHLQSLFQPPPGFLQLFRRGAQVEADASGVHADEQGGAGIVGQPGFLPDVGENGTGHVTAPGLEQQRLRHFRGSHVHARHSHHQHGLLLVQHGHLPASAQRGRGSQDRRHSGPHSAKTLFQKRENLLLPDISGNAYHGIGGADDAFILFLHVPHCQ